MLKRRQYSLAYLFVCISGVAVAAGFIRLCFFWGEWILWWFTVLLVAIVGGSFAALGAWLMFHAVRVIIYWPSASATIVRYTIRRYEKQPFYHAVVRFVTSGGTPVIAIWNSGYWRRYWPVGSIVTVRYDPRNPKWIEIVLPSNLWGFARGLFLLFFLVFMALIAYVLPKYAGRPTMFDMP